MQSMRPEKSSLGWPPDKEEAISQSLKPPTTPSFRGLNNPLSAKVTSILSVSHADSDFRDSLSILNEQALSNTGETRRQLRLTLQRNVIQSNGEIIREFGRVAEQLRRIGMILENISQGYQESGQEVRDAYRGTSASLEDAAALGDKMDQVEIQQDVLERFTHTYVLSSTEIDRLTRVTEPIDDDFFVTLAKAVKIQKDCEIILGFENQTLGHELMERTSKTIDLSFQKIYKWVQREFRSLNLEVPQINIPVRRAIRILAERPSLFQNCLDSFAEARERILSDSFHIALTGSSQSGQPSGFAKPIEIAAHDPLRYVGDMLAWTHSTAVSEREALETLFVADGEDISKGFETSRENDIWGLSTATGNDAESAFDAVSSLNGLVDRDTSGVSRILRQRVEQVIQTNEEAILAFQLANLLGFYRATFARLLGAETLLYDTASALEFEAMRQFRSLMKDQVATLRGNAQHLPLTLEPPGFLLDALDRLLPILKTYDTSLETTQDRQAGFLSVLSDALDPFLEGCANMAQQAPQPQGSIFLINCFQAALLELRSFDFTQDRVLELERNIKMESERVEGSQYEFLRAKSGLDILFQTAAELDDNRADYATLASLDPFKPEALTRASQSLDDFLPSALMDAIERVSLLQDAKIARQLTEAAIESFCSDFEKVEELLSLAEDGKEKGDTPTVILREAFPRTAGEIRVLLS